MGHFNPFQLLGPGEKGIFFCLNTQNLLISLKSVKALKKNHPVQYRQLSKLPGPHRDDWCNNIINIWTIENQLWLSKCKLGICTCLKAALISLSQLIICWILLGEAYKWEVKFGSLFKVKSAGN